MKHVLILLILIILLPIGYAAEKEMALLAVAETPEGLVGNVASLSVEITKGSGRVFIDSFPLTKLDTQLSTRFAKQMACEHSTIDCERHDFFYTIRSTSSIIGGPSAGAAITLLTIATLEGYDHDPTLSISGTINSGGLIGPVGGLKEKIEVAAAKGLTKVLIPEGGRYLEIDNHTLDLVFHGDELGITVVEIATIDQALEEFYGISPPVNEASITLSQDYLRIMEGLAGDLCERASILRSDALSLLADNDSLIDEGKDLLDQGNLALEEKRLYSSASFCFGAGLNFREHLVEKSNLTKEEGSALLATVDLDIREAEHNVDALIPETVTDLQTLMIVRERIIEARDFHTLATEIFLENGSYAYQLGYSIERLASAQSWSNFFGLEGDSLVLDSRRLEQGCLEKIAEAQERLNYVQLFLPIPLSETQKEIDYAGQDRARGDFELCLFKASKAKAEADVVMGALGFDEDELNKTLRRKLDVARKVIVAQTEKGRFPILGYSYYEYAKSLEGSDTSSALIYAEYALELSDLDRYFGGPEKRISSALEIDKSHVWVLLTGLALGLLLGFLLFMPKKRRTLSRKRSR